MGARRARVVRRGGVARRVSEPACRRRRRPGRAELWRQCRAAHRCQASLRSGQCLPFRDSAARTRCRGGYSLKEKESQMMLSTKRRGFLRAVQRRMFALAALTIATAYAAAKATAADTAQVTRGQYLVQLGGCNDCHTPGYLLGK